MSVRSDVCSSCEKHREKIAHAVTEEEQMDSLAAFTAHLQLAQAERRFYQDVSRKAHEELIVHQPVYAPPYLPCSQPLQSVLYTFDFAQQVTFPHLFCQPGLLCFKTPRKVQIFGVCSEGRPKQINYHLDEAETIGPNGTKVHGANTVVSLLHDFFRQHGYGEVECVLHADNCAGQNKN